MTRRAEIAPEVAALLPADTRDRLEEMLAGRLRCPACERQLGPDEPTAVSIVQFTGDPPGGPQLTVFFAHPACFPSQVRRHSGTLPQLVTADPTGGNVDYVLAILAGHPAVIYEPTSILIRPNGPETTDTWISNLLEQGFMLIPRTQQLQQADTVWAVNGWRAQITAELLTVTTADGAEVRAAVTGAPPDWPRLAASSPDLLLVTGTGLGLELGGDVNAGLDRAARAGRLIAARIPLSTPGRPPQPGDTSSEQPDG